MIFSPEKIAQRRKRTEVQLASVMSPAEVLLISSGEALSQPGGLDQTYPFLPNPNFYWLTGSRRAGEALTYSVEGGWQDFYRPVSQEEILWEGLAAEQVEARGKPIKELSGALLAFKDREILKIGEANSMSGAPLRSLEILEAIHRARRIKDSEELDLIRKTAAMAGAGYSFLKGFDFTGRSERDFCLNYEFQVQQAGSEGFPYGTLVGSGERSAILHAEPSNKKIAKGDAILIDGGARLFDYGVDITRMFWCGSASEQQKDLYQLVLRGQEAALALCRSGVHWHDIHREAARSMAGGLISLGVMKGSVEDILESGAISVFFPHGVGHMTGQRVRDVGGDVTSPLMKVCGVTVRVDLLLDSGFVMTVEPGIYFARGVMDFHRSSGNFDDFVCWDEALKWVPVGGVRIEDDVLIQADGCEILTAHISK